MDIKSALKSFVGNASPLGVVTSLGSSIAGAISQNKIVNKQIEAQAAENQKNREYNLMLARMQNQWNLDQWQRENDYNSPTSQMARLRAAGLNPDLMYGQGTTGNSNSSPMLTSGAPSSPQDMSPLLSKRSFGNVVQDTLNQEMQRAQIEAIRANTRKTEEETEGIGIDNYIKNGTKEDTIKLAGLQVTGAKILNDLNETQRSSLLKSIELASQSIEESKVRMESIRASIADMNFKQRQDAERLALEKLRNSAEIRNLDASTKKLIAEAGLTERQYFEAVETFALRQAGLIKDNEIKDEQVAKLVSECDVLSNEYKSGSFKLQRDMYKNKPFVKTNIVNRLISSTYGAASLIFGAIRGE